MNVSSMNLGNQYGRVLSEAVVGKAKFANPAANVLRNVACFTLGTGTALGAAKLYNAKTGKAFGVPASLAHIVSNDKLDNKGAVVKEQLKEGCKDLLTLGGLTAGTAATASLVTGNSNTVTNALHSMKSKVGTYLDKFIIAGAKYEPELGLIKNHTIKTKIQSMPIYQKINALPTPAKAAIAAGAAALAVLTPLMSLVTSQKAGYIEGQHEVK